MRNTLTLISTAAIAMAFTACAASTDTYADKKDKSDMEMSEMETATDTMEMKDASMTTPMVGGAAMYPNKTIVENASAASNLTTLVAAVAQAELVETLSGPGPFTVFAPTNTAFGGVPSATLDTLMMDSSRKDLQKILTGHVVAGTVTASDLIAQIAANGGSYTFTTVSGDSLTALLSGDKVKIADERGYMATVTKADVMQSNGVVHVIDSVLIGE